MKALTDGPVDESLVRVRPESPTDSIMSGWPTQPTGTSGRAETVTGTPIRPTATTATGTGRVRPTATSSGRVAVAPTATAADRVPDHPDTTGPMYHVRIMTFGAAEPRDVDVLRGFLSQQGIETDLKLTNQSYILFSQDQFAEKAKSNALAVRVNKALVEYGKMTHKPVRNDALSEPVK